MEHMDKERDVEQLLRWHLQKVAYSASLGSAHATWSDAEARRECQQAWDEKKAAITVDELREIDVNELYKMGFLNWNGQGLVLLPLWAFNAVKEGELLTSIHGEVVPKGQEMDLEDRGMCIAFGFNHPTLVALAANRAEGE